MPSIKILETPHIYELTAPVSNSKLPVLVFVHGWLLSRHYWHPLVQFLKAEYQCLIYDAKGFGESQITQPLGQDNLVGGSPAVSRTAFPVKNHAVSVQPNTPRLKLHAGSHRQVPPLHSDNQGNVEQNITQDYSLNGYAQDLVCLLESLNIEQAWLIGHSLGGSIALWAADLCPSVVQGVVCLNAGGGIYLKEEFERFRNVGQQLVRFRPRWLSLVPGLDFLFARMMVARPLGIKWGRRRVIDFIQADEQAALGALLESTTEAEVHLLPQLVSRLQQPVYFIAGDQDKVMETKYVNHLASFHHLFAAPESNVFQLNNCGHLGMIEATEEVAMIVKRVLDNHLEIN